MKNFLIILGLILLSSCAQNESKKSAEINTKDCISNSSFCFPNCETPEARWVFSSDYTFAFKSKILFISAKGSWKDLGGGEIQLRYLENSKQGEVKKDTSIKLTDCGSFVFEDIKYIK